MKKYFLIFLVAISIFNLAGCGGDTERDEEVEIEEDGEVDDD